MAKDCTIFPDNPSHCDVIVAVKRTVASLSMVGSLFIIFIIWLFQKYRHFEQRLILALSVAAFMSCISYLMGDLHPEKGPACILQAWWLTDFNRCVILWICCITFNLYWNFIKHRNTRKFEKWYHVISWGISLVISLLPLIDDHYGPAGPWCWIPRESSNSTVWRFMMWYVPLFIIITILFIVYGYIIYTYRKKGWTGTYSEEQQRQDSFPKRVKQLVAYPCIYLALSILPLVHRIYNAATAVPSFPLLLLHVIYNPLPGALNAIAYGLDKETLNRLNWQHMKAAVLHRFRADPPTEEYQTEPTVTMGNDLDVFARQPSSAKPTERSKHYQNDVDVDKVRNDVYNDVRDDDDNDNGNNNNDDDD